MEERFGVAAFRSRQQVTAFHQALRRAGVSASIVSTPRAVAVGCGLSVKFPLEEAAMAQAVYRAAQPGNLIGFYEAVNGPGGRVACHPMGVEMGYHG